MVHGMGASAGSTTLAALLLRPGLPGTSSELAAPASRVQGASDAVALSVQAQPWADQAKHAVTALETDGARWSAAAFDWLLHQRMLALLAAEVDAAFSPASPTPTAPGRGWAVDLADLAV